MAYDVVMPQLGMTMEEGSVLRWFKEPGDAIEKGEPLFEVQTDKVDMEVEAQASGFVAEILIEPGQTVPVGTVIGRIAESKLKEVEGPGALRGSKESPAAPPVQDAPSLGGPDRTMTSASPQPGGEPVQTAVRKLASPRARRVAQDRGVDIELVEGSGQGGRITEADVLRYLEGREGQASQAGRLPAILEVPSTARKTVASRMTRSFERVPHFYLTAQADATDLKKARDDLLPVIERESGLRLTYTDFLVKALGVAVQENPYINVAWHSEGIVHGAAINIAFAAQIGDTLLAPVIRSVDRLDLRDIAKLRSDLVARAKGGELKPADLEEASCTLSNLGSFGVDLFQAIINPPQSVILAVGRISPRPVAINGEVGVRTTVWLTLSADHRVIDGVAGAKFLGSIVKAIQSPYRLIMGAR